jgi:CRISPR-associated endonuclease/helicase Cas3
MNYTILAKGRSDNYMSLYDHTDHVIQCIVPFAKEYGLDVEVAKNGAILHDLGKAHPAFQAMLIYEPNDERAKWLSKLPTRSAVEFYLERRDNNCPPTYRHELGSLGFLSLCPEEQWPALVEMIVAHHKSVVNDKSGRGLLDLTDDKHGFEVSEIAEDHLAFWEDWAPAALAVASRFGLPCSAISKEQAEANFKYAHDYTLALSSGRSSYRGVLMSADHFGSGYKYDAASRVDALFGLPDHSAFTARMNSSRAHLYPLSMVPTDDPRPHTIVTAPTGAGKTDFLVRRCRGRIFYTLPFQASINSMYKRFVTDMPGSDVRRLHSASKVSLDKVDEEKSYEHHEDIDLQQHPGAAVKVLTPHQLVALALCTPGHEAIALDVQGQDVILDEVHTYNDESRMMIIKIVQSLVYLNCRVHVGTATLPTWLNDKLHSLLGGEAQVELVSLPANVLDTFDRHTIYKSYRGEPISDQNFGKIVREATEMDEKVLVVVNRVARAQELYCQFKKLFPEIPIVLIHSRYRRMDRTKLEAEIVSLQEKNRTGPAIAIATQVVEVSLDISYDRMITEAAPLDALIQRFGRVNRRRDEDTIGRYRPIHILPPPTEERDVKPYSLAAVNKSYGVLPDTDVLRERNVQNLMDQVFSEIEEGVESSEYKVDEHGNCKLMKLQHQPRSTVVSVLNIEGYTCITDEDLSSYRRADFRNKPSYEIPVGKSFARFGFAVEESGSYPFILPTKYYHFKDMHKLGLSMDEAMQPVNDQLL